MPRYSETGEFEHYVRFEKLLFLKKSFFTGAIQLDFLSSSSSSFLSPTHKKMDLVHDSRVRAEVTK